MAKASPAPVKVSFKSANGSVIRHCHIRAKDCLQVLARGNDAPLLTRHKSAPKIFRRTDMDVAVTGQREVDDGIWLTGFMHYDLGYFDLEQKTLQPLGNPFGTRLSPMS